MTTEKSDVVKTLYDKISDAAGKMAGLGADLAEDIKDGDVDILDCMLLFWIFLTACVVIGVSWWDFSRKKNQAGQGGDGTSRVGDRHGRGGRVLAGAAGDSSGSLAGQGETCRWVNSVVAWMYLHQSQAPGHIVLSWLKALNEHTKKRGSTVQVTFDRLKAGSLPPKFSTVRAEAGPRDLLTITCQVEASGVAFVIFATQQTPSSVKLSTCDVIIDQLSGKIQVKVQNIHEELLQVNASFEGTPNLQLSVKPQNSSKNDPVDLLVVEEIVRSALMGAITTVDLSPSMVPPPIREVITASQAGYQMAQRAPYQTAPSLFMSRVPIRTNANLRMTSAGQVNASRPTPADRRLLVKVIKANGLRERDSMTASDPFCVVIMDQPSQKHKTNIIRNTVNPFWDEHFLFELGSISRELRFEVYDRDRMLRETLSNAVKDMTESIKAGREVNNDEFIGEAIVSLEALERNPSSRQIIPLQGRELEVDNIKGSLTVEGTELEGDSIKGALTVEFLFMEPADQVYMDSPGNAGVTYKSRVPASPTKRVETQRTVTPDGTVITTVTTTTARPKQMSDRKAAMNNVPTRVVTTSSTLPEPQHAATTLITDPNDETTTTTDQNMQGSPGYGPSAGYGPTGGYSPDTPNSGTGGSINYSDGTPSPGPSFGYNGDVQQPETVTVDSQGNPTTSVAETAIKHLSEHSQEKPPQQRTPTKKSTLIIHGVSQTPTQDLSLESPDEPKESNFKRDASPRGSKRRFNPFKKKDKEPKEPKETKEEKKKRKEKRRISDASTESGERKSRKDKDQSSKANTLDVPPSSGKRSSSLSRESSPSRAKRKVMNFLRRDKGRGRSQSETSDELLNGNAESPTSTSASVNVSLSVPGQARSASTGDLQHAQGTLEDTRHMPDTRHQAQAAASKPQPSTVTQRPLAKPDTKR